MPIYQINNVSESVKVALWKITESEESLINSVIKKGYKNSEIYKTNNKQRLKQWLATRLLLANFFNNSKIYYI